MSIVAEMVDSLGLRPAIVRAGLDFQVGTAGSRLTAGQRQKAALARALIKRADLLVADEPLVALDGVSQRRITERVLNGNDCAGVIWVLQRAGAASAFADVIVVDGGRVIESGRFEELSRNGVALPAMLQND